MFSLSLCMKMWKFSIAREQRIALIPCIRIGVVTRSVSLPYAIRVWGIASFIYSCTGLSTTFIQIDGEELHTFCLFMYNHSGARGKTLRLLTNMYFAKQEGYIAPEVDVLEVVVECGFAGSTLEDIEEERPEIDW